MDTILGASSMSRMFTYLTAFVGAFLAALWLSLIFWTLRDIRNRSQDRLVHYLATFVVAILNLPGIFIYLILRPPQTLEEAYQEALEEEALLSTIEGSRQCPSCGARVEKSWQVCANCHTRLRKTCHHCGKLLELPWQLCPYCATKVPGSASEAEFEDV
jgi:RNA polymerase subunit RPABC4/transcription elongation factor Spt4